MDSIRAVIITWLRFGKLLQAACNIMLILFFVLFVVMSVVSCTDRNTAAAFHGRIKETAPDTEGDIYSVERWKLIQKNISKIMTGMSRREVVHLLGYPNFQQFTSKRIMQYTVAYGVLGEDHPSLTVHIVLDVNDKVAEVKDAVLDMEGDVFSAKRWKLIQKNISKITAGMSRLEVVHLLGLPNDIQFAPKHIMQYTVAYGVLGEEHPTSTIHIVLDANGKVVEIRQNTFLYGPQPH